MNGLTIIETEVLSGIFKKLEKIEAFVKETETAKKPWMSLKEVCEYMGKGSTWVDMNKASIGFTKAGGEIRFKRKDVDAYLESRYYKSK